MTSHHQEFVTALTPMLESVFASRGTDQWMPLYHTEPCGDTYLYWYNRSTGESDWMKPE